MKAYERKNGLLNWSLTGLLLLISVPVQAELDAVTQESVNAYLRYESGRLPVYIADNNLTWMKCSVGQVWRNRTCEGKAKELTWQQALDYAKNFSYAGYSDWRVPTIAEIKTLVVKGRKPTIDAEKFPNTPSEWYWTSSPYAYDSAWGVTFQYGYGYILILNNYIHVRLVRSGQ